ncbi:hypothetical protein RDV78_07430 [Bacillota bacterium LX-D]|nr:hypothetical protein [Bacillota bacterium LX-D]
MVFFGYILVIAVVLHTLSYAKFNLDKGNKLAAFGVSLIALLALILPIYIGIILS